MATTTTTLARAAGINDQILYLTSSATAAPGTIVQKGAEFAKVIKVLNTGAVRVQRGANGTSATTGAASDAVTLGDVEDFVSAAPISGIADGAPMVVFPSNPPAGVTAAAGDVVGPASATSGRIAVFSGTTGKLIADSGVTGVTAGPFTTISSIRVVNGIVTVLTGS